MIKAMVFISSFNLMMEYPHLKQPILFVDILHLNALSILYVYRVLNVEYKNFSILENWGSEFLIIFVPDGKFSASFQIKSN